MSRSNKQKATRLSPDSDPGFAGQAGNRGAGAAVWPSIRELHEELLRGDVSAEELLDRSLAAIRAADDDLHAFLHVDESAARARAQAIDRQLASDERSSLSVLAGIPYAAKDNICVADMPATAGSKILEGFVPPYSATVVERLAAAGAVLVGKTNLDEFAMGSSTENSAFGPTRNPHDPSRVPGGSSGGSAAAVAAGMVPFALGTDTGGSVRQPAAFCGVVGLYPTYGRVSRYGLIALASSFDQAAPLARTVEDVARVFAAIAGPDARDGTTLPEDPPDVLGALSAGVAGIKIGIPAELWPEGVDPRVARTVRAAVDALVSAGAEVRKVSLPLVRVALAVYYILVPAEASTNLARYDGVRFGARFGSRATTYEELITDVRGRGFGPEPKRRIILGTFALSAGYADRYYRTAAAVRRALAREMARTFQDVDVLACPATPELAFRLGAKTDDPLRMYASDVLTVPVNVAGVPALVVPCGSVEGLPVGLQLIAAQRREELLFRVGRAYERL